jgi:glycine amidinotransferase
LELNTFDDWSPLREIILGSATNYVSHSRDLSFDLFFQDNVTPVHSYYPRVEARAAADVGGSPALENRREIKRRYVEELAEDLENFAVALNGLGVNVLRPMELAPDTSTVKGLAWQATVLPPLNLRDITLIIGDEIIETPPMLRARYFETQFLNPVFTHYARQGARWTVMPRPLLTDASFDRGYGDRSVGNTELITDVRSSAYDVGIEPMIDGAQCLRLGRDIVVNIATENHKLACDWLERHLQGRFRVHRMYGLTANHIDSMVLPLRPGQLLVRNEGVRDFLPEPLRRWDTIVAPEPDLDSFPIYDDDDLVLTSPFIDLNVLSIDENTVMVNEDGKALITTLEAHGYDVVTVRHRHRRLFGGGLHCFTLDTVRDGGDESYF